MRRQPANVRKTSKEENAARIGARAAIVAAIIGAVAVIAAVLIPMLAHSSSAPQTSQATGGTNSVATGETGPAGQQLGTGLLVLPGDRTAYDLDAVNHGWDPLAQHAWVTQNIMYDSTGNNGAPLIDIAGSPATDVLMPGTGPWTYHDCATAPYRADSPTTGPNAITGASLKAGKGICVETENTGTKSDGNHYVLLVLKSVTPEQVTAQVTVWFR